MEKDLATRIKQLQKAVLAYKTGQGTQGDSANYYCVFYMPGWYISDQNHWREHTIKCIPYVNDKKAIFMPQMSITGSWSITGAEAAGRSLCYTQDIITWMQMGETQERLNNEGYAAGVSKGLAIFSNVDFYIETSYVDKSY